MDVPVIMLEFLQSMSYEDLEVPQIQLIVEVVAFQLCRRPTVLSFVLQVQFLEVVDMPVVLQRQVRAAAVCRQGCQHPCRGAEADPYGSVCSEDHSDSPLQCVDKVVNVLVVRVVHVPQVQVDVPVVLVVQVSQVLSWWRQCSHSCRSLRKSARVLGQSRCHARWCATTGAVGVGVALKTGGVYP